MTEKLPETNGYSEEICVFSPKTGNKLVGNKKKFSTTIAGK